MTCAFQYLVHNLRQLHHRWGDSMDSNTPSHPTSPPKGNDCLTLPPVKEGIDSLLDQGRPQTVSVDGTNVIRVPFGVRQARLQRPERPERWATLVLPIQPLGDPTPPPQAA